MSTIRVVVPLDGLELAEAALRYVPVLASLGPLRVRLVAVAEDGETYGLAKPREWQDRQAHLLKAYLDDLPAKIQTPDIKVETSVRRGNPAETIVIDANRFGADFILLSTHGRSGVSRWRVGSVADKVIRTARCNTLAVGPEASLEQPKTAVRSITVPLDGSELAETAMPLATRLASELGAQLHLVQVVATLPTEMFAGFDIADMNKVVQQYLDEVAKDRWQVRPTTNVLNGPAAESLLFYAGQEAIDLVVMTSHGRGGLLRATLGSVTDRLLGGPAAVLIVRKEVPAPSKS